MQAVSLLPAFPQLEELYLGHNEISSLSFDSADRMDSITLKVITLTFTGPNLAAARVQMTGSVTDQCKGLCPCLENSSSKAGDLLLTKYRPLLYKSLEHLKSEVAAVANVRRTFCRLWAWRTTGSVSGKRFASYKGCATCSACI